MPTTDVLLKEKCVAETFSDSFFIYCTLSSSKSLPPLLFNKSVHVADTEQFVRIHVLCWCWFVAGLNFYLQKNWAKSSSDFSKILIKHILRNFPCNNNLIGKKYYFYWIGGVRAEGWGAHSHYPIPLREWGKRWVVIGTRGEGRGGKGGGEQSARTPEFAYD